MPKSGSDSRLRLRKIRLEYYPNLSASVQAMRAKFDVPAGVPYLMMISGPMSAFGTTVESQGM